MWARKVSNGQWLSKRVARVLLSSLYTVLSSEIHIRCHNCFNEKSLFFLIFYRFRDTSSSFDASSKRYVITNPPVDFQLLPTDQVSFIFYKIKGIYWQVKSKFGFCHLRGHCSNVSTNPITITRIFSPLANGTDLNRQKYAILQNHWHYNWSVMELKCP